MVSRSIVNLVFLAISFGSSPVAAQSIITLTPDQAACVAENVGLYLEPGTEPVVVVPKTCPDPPSLDDLMAALSPQNLGRDLPEPKLGEPDAALVLMASELECFGARYAAGDLTVKADGLIVVALENCEG